MELKEFFSELYPDFDKNEHKIDVFPFNLNKRPVKQKRKFCTTLDEVITYAKQLDAQGKYHIYFRCPELKPDADNGTEDNIACHTFLYADIDMFEKKENEVVKKYTKEELLQKIDNFNPKPSIVVDSGNGYHVYFLLKTPIYDRTLVRKLLDAINTKLDSDKNATKLTQLLRIPETHNIKDVKKGGLPKEVKIVRYNKCRYSPEELSALLLKSDTETVTKQTKQHAVRNGTNININSPIRFDFSTPPPPLGITIDNFPELLDCLKKQNIFLASNRPDHPLGKAFNCVFHPDEHPSANIFVSKTNGYYYYKCFACGYLYDIISLYQKIKNCNFAEAIKNLAKFFGIKFKYNDWIISQLDKYYQNANLIENFEEYGYHEMYPNLYKLLKPRIHYLSLINHYGLSKISSSDKYVYEDNNLFFFSYRYFSSKYKTDLQALVRNVNLFATLGFIKKVPISEVPASIAQKAIENKDKHQHNTINFYIIPNFQDVLPEAELRAKTLLENNFSITKCMNKIFLIKVFGQDFANLVYPDERSISKKSLSLAKRLETTLLKLISTQGYATKDQIVSKTIVSGRMKVTREDKERELQRNLSLFLKEHNLEYVTANKELKEKFGLKKYIKIIIPKGTK